MTPEAKYQRIFRKNNPEKAKENDRKKRIKRRSKMAIYSKEHYKQIKDSPAYKKMRNKRTLKYYYKNKEKALARNKVNKHIRDRKIMKPELCQLCHTKTELTAHHEDYKKPLEVLWVCPSCHRVIENYKLLTKNQALRELGEIEILEELDEFKVAKIISGFFIDRKIPKAELCCYLATELCSRFGIKKVSIEEIGKKIKNFIVIRKGVEGYIDEEMILGLAKTIVDSINMGG